MRLRRIEAGIYATPDRKFQVERVGSVGEFDSYTECWVVSQYRDEDAADNGKEIFEAGTKRRCVEWLDDHLKTILGNENLS